MAAAEELDRPAPLPLAGAIAQGSEPVEDRDPTMLPSTTTAIDPTTTVAIAPVGDEAPAGDYVEPGGQTKRRRRWPMILVGALIVGALAVAGLVAWNTVLVPEHEVPNFVGTTIAEAEELIDQNNWDLAEPREVRRDDTEPGQVLDQDPDPGESLREGDEVVLTISAGQELHAVPQEVIGIPFADAQALLQQAGLAGVEAERRNDEAVARDSVIAFAEGTPEQAETGSEIGLVVSDGPAPRTIPETAGNTLEQACAAIGGVQLQCEQGQAFSDTVPQGTVIGTDPPAGQQVHRDSAVTVLVSQGPELRPIPDVSGRDVVTAAQMLEDAGFTVAGVQGNPFRTVRATNPPAGTRERPGTGVVLIDSLARVRRAWGCSTDAWSSSPGLHGASVASTPCCWRPRAHGSSSTTSTATRPKRSRPRSAAPAARPSPTATTAATGTAATGWCRRPSTPTAASTSW